LEVEFLNVNQGDSIIIKWEIEGQLKIGLVDCHTDNLSPTLQFIKDHSIKEIEFILISHPHFDHFSGVVELLSYCEGRAKPISIKELGFTFDSAVSIAYADLSSRKAEGLLEFFEFLRVQSRKKKIENKTILHSFPLNNETKSKSFEEFTIDFLAPRHDQIISIATSYGRFMSGRIKTEPNLNNYSSILELRKNDSSVLLTSDAPISAFKSLEKYYSTRERIFNLVQIPHHGSIHNHYIDFWNNLSKIKKCPSVFSVGEEPKDELPDFRVVEEIDNAGYRVHSTNTVYGISEFLNQSTKVKKPSIMKSSCKVKSKSTKVKVSNRFEGNQVFTI